MFNVVYSIKNQVKSVMVEWSSIAEPEMWSAMVQFIADQNEVQREEVAVLYVQNIAKL
jgi:hypothetical protein